MDGPFGPRGSRTHDPRFLDPEEVEVARGKLAGVVATVEKSAVSTGRSVSAVSKLCTLVGASSRFFTG